MKNSEAFYIGLMSGTSLDGVDAVLMQCAPTLEILGTHFQPFPESLHQQLLTLCSPGDNEIDLLGIADRQLGEVYADAVQSLLAATGRTPADITAIGSHGQTIRHRPGQQGFSMQIGSADVLATRTGICVVNNFRNRDMVLGGQGAPLVPVFHCHAFADANERRAIVNIGGMANITVLNGDQVELGYDTGPGNVLMDAWSQRYQHKPCDTNGDWARTGEVIPSLLDELLADDYFHRPAPKSTGREQFNESWLAHHLAGDDQPVDIPCTLAELTASSIARDVRNNNVERVYVCGGGAHNGWLMARLQALLSEIPCTSTDSLGIAPDWVEACAFAWLAHARLHAIPGTAPSGTGAQRPAVLGAVYLP